MAIMQVPVTKAKGGFVEIDTTALPEEVYIEAVLQGLKTLINRGMSKITIAELGSEETVKQEAMIAAQKNVEKVLKGDIKFSGKAKTAKLSGAVNTEAMRIARGRVKDAMKAAGMKISYVKASQITEAAKQLLATDSGADIIAQAKANLEARAATPLPIDIKSLVHEDAELKAKGEAKAAADKASKPLSAKQSGLVKGRKKPAPQANA